MSFHEIRFPTTISRGAQGGPERRTDIVVLGSGYEERNSRWANSRRAYNAGYGVRSLDDLYAVTAFFEERRGRLHGFRWKDHADYKSDECTDQTGTNDVLGLQIIAGMDVLLVEAGLVLGDNVQEKIAYACRVQIIGNLMRTLKRRRKVVNAIHHASPVTSCAC